MACASYCADSLSSPSPPSEEDAAQGGVVELVQQRECSTVSEMIKTFKPSLNQGSSASSNSQPLFNYDCRSSVSGQSDQVRHLWWTKKGKTVFANPQQTNLKYICEGIQNQQHLDVTLICIDIVG
eukprot:1183353-Prorocentrum_minimum.AAC.3